MVRGKWTQNGWSHNASDTRTYGPDTDGYSGTVSLGTVSPGTRTSAPTGTGSAGATRTTTSIGSASYSGTVKTPDSTSTSGADITRSTMYLNGSYYASGQGSNYFWYTFTNLQPNTYYSVSIDWYSGSTYVGSNSSNGTTDVRPLPATPSNLTSLNLYPITDSGRVGGRVTWSVGANTTYVSVSLGNEVHNLTIGSGTSYDFWSNGGAGYNEGQYYTAYATPYNTDAYGQSSAGNQSGSGAVQMYSRPSSTPANVRVQEIGSPNVFRVTWNTVADATTGYAIYANDNEGSGDVLKASVSNSYDYYADIVLDRQWVKYTVKVVPRNSVGLGRNPGSYDFKTPDLTPPTTSGSIGYGEVTDSMIDVYVNGAYDAGSGVWGYIFYYIAGANNANVFNSGVQTKYFVNPAGMKITGLTQNTNYTIGVRAFDYSNNLATDSKMITVKTAQSIPTMVTVSSRFDNGFNLSWGGVNYATHYELNYKPTVNSFWNSLITTGNTASVNLAPYGMQYDFRVRVSMDGGSSWNPWSGVTNATTNPKTPTLTGEYDGTTASFIIGGMSGTTFNAVVVERRLRSNDTFVDQQVVTSNGAYVQWSIASNIVGNYYFRAYSSLTTNSGAVLTSLSYSQKIEFLRPVSFNWTGGDKVAGAKLTITSSDWNEFTKRINAFRAYKGFSAASFTTVSSGTPISAAIYNQASNAINAINPPTKATTVTSGVTSISATLINSIKNALNSIA